jgi:isoleucyl-tRNA synthetase
VSRVLLPLWNSYRFFSEQATLYKKTTNRDFVAQLVFADDGLNNVMDRWVLADCQSPLRFMDEEMRCE